MPTNIDKKTQRFIDLIIFICVLVFYSFTLHKGVGGLESYGNSTKFQYIGVILGVPHSPGYPLYVIINYLWTHIPLAISTADKINLLSAVFAAAALTFFRRLLDNLNVKPYAAIIATIALGLSRIFWIRATEAGPAAMSYFLVTVTLFIVTRYFVNKKLSYLIWAIIFTFISAFHDPLILMLSPVIFAFLIAVNPTAWKKKEAWLACLTGILITIILYSFIYVRSHQHAPVLEFVYRNTTIKRIVLTALNAQFLPNYFVATSGYIFFRRLPQLFSELSAQLTVAVFVFAFVGFIYLFRKSVLIGLFFTITFILAFLLKAHIYSPNILFEYWLVFLLAALLIGCGLQFFINYKKSIGKILSITFLILILFNTLQRNKDLIIRKNANDYRELLLACTYNSNLLATDIYKWQEILRYYNFTNPYIKNRNIKLKNNFNFYNHSTNFFFEKNIKKQLEEANIPYLTIYSNQTTTLYLIDNL